MKENNFVPRWNLGQLYENLSSAAYTDDLEKLRVLIKKLDDQLSSCGDDKMLQESFNVFLNSFLADYNEMLSLLKSLSAYAYIIYSTDTTNPDYMNNLNVMDKIESEQKILFLKVSAFLSLNEENLCGFYEAYPEKKEYDFLFKEIILDRDHQMSCQEEGLASLMGHTGSNAWSLLQEQLISNLHDENGKTFNELRNDAYDDDCLLRKKSWQKEIELLRANEISFAAALNNLKGETVTLNKKRKWQTALDRALVSGRLSKKTLDAMISSIEKSLPEWRKYFKAKARLLRMAGATASESAGLENAEGETEGIAFYDLFAPVKNPAKGGECESSLISKKWTFDEARDYVLKEYYSFSRDMGDFAKAAFEKGWIDAEVRSGKVGGAYDEDFPKGHQSRILSNFTGSFSDIITLAHELGHAYHFSCMKGKAPAFFDYPMTLAESASTFAETIVKQDMLKESSGFDRIKFLDLDLTDAGQVLVDILSRFYFEKSVFDLKEKGQELNAEDFCRLMKDAQERSYGSGLNGERHEYMWAVKSHYYISDLDFYNFPYAFGQLFASGLYERSLKEGPLFAKTYSEILSRTGSMSCEELCKSAGFDISESDFWEASLKIFRDEIKEYCDLVKKL